MAEPLCDLSGGELRSAPLAAILVEALRLRATGELRVDANGGTSRVYLRGGQPCGAQVFFGFKPLGQFLLEQGWIDMEALERSLAAVVDGRKQGEALVELGFLSREKLHLGLALHHQRHIRNLAAVAEGIYSFQPLAELPAWTDELKLSAHRAIVDALSAPPALAVCQKILRRIPGGLGVRLRSGWDRYTGHFQLDAAELAFLAGLERPCAIDAAVAAGHVPEERALALLAALQLMGILVPAPLGGEAPWATPGPAIPSTPGPVRLDTPPPVLGRAPAGPNVVAPNRAVIAGAGKPLEVDLGFGLGDHAAGDWGGSFQAEEAIEVDEVEIVELVEEPQRGRVVELDMDATAVVGGAFAEAPTVAARPGIDFEATMAARPGPGDIGPAERAALEAQQRRAQEEARKLQREQQAHEERAREEALRRPAPEFKSDAGEAKERRARMLQRAFGNILGTDAIRRREGTPGPGYAGTPGPAAMGTPGPGTPGPTAARLSWDRLPPPGDPAFDRFVHERLATLHLDDHYKRLGVAQGASRDEIKHAFFAAAKRFHPDRIPSAIQHLAPQLKEIFAAVNESYQVLQDDERRRAYLAELRQAAAPPPKSEVQQAVEDFEAQAAAAAKKKDFATVQRLLKQALLIEDRPDLRAHILWARQSEKPDEAGQVRIDLERLVEEHPRCAIAHHYLGVLLRVAGDTPGAEAAFHRALEIAPDHREARQELRLIELRKANNPHLRKR
ncbi:DnaJ domain-containing protein [Vulgatibacter sp.]|uniref:DnaJ domain-containing protein n=1 Tax=Vulgatibacter sp. TaxID=1971226 RepID=UPI003566C53D